MEQRYFMGKRTESRTESRDKSARTINGYSYKSYDTKLAKEYAKYMVGEIASVKGK